MIITIRLTHYYYNTSHHNSNDSKDGARLPTEEVRRTDNVGLGALAVQRGQPAGGHGNSKCLNS